VNGTSSPEMVTVHSGWYSELPHSTTMSLTLSGNAGLRISEKMNRRHLSSRDLQAYRRLHTCQRRQGSQLQPAPELALGQASPVAALGTSLFLGSRPLAAKWRANRREERKSPRWRRARSMFCQFLSLSTGTAPAFVGSSNQDPEGRGVESVHVAGCYARVWSASGPRAANRNYPSAFFPIMQNPLPNGSLQKAMGGRSPPSNSCSHLAPAFNALTKTPSKSSTWKSM